MSELLSVGLDVGTTTTQLIVSRLTVENRAGSFAVPEMEIAGRDVVYRSQVYFTPLLGENRVDGECVRRIVDAEYEKAGIRPEQVDTGAVIITGETSRKENARAVLDALSEYAGQFVVATAGPDLESVLAAKGAGAVEFSCQTGKAVLHMDIGGGTSNLALIENGRIVRTGCLNVGGRLLKFDKGGKVSYVSPVLRGLTDLQPGDYATAEQVEGIARSLVHGLEMAAGLREITPLLEKLWTRESESGWQAGDCHISDIGHWRAMTDKRCVISFSGGVADCIEKGHRPGVFGDMGVELGQAIRESLLCRGEYMLGSQTIRATVIGAGCHSAQLSGSTVFYRGVRLPLKNLPVAAFTPQEQDAEDLDRIIQDRFRRADSDTVVLAMPGYTQGGYDRVAQLAAKIVRGASGRQVLVCLEADMAKALGQKICLLLPKDAPCLCIDRVRLGEDSFLDVGNPVGPALPVVVKTLVMEQES